MVDVRKRKGGRDGAASGGVDSTYDNAKNRRSKGKSSIWDIMSYNL